MTIQVELATFCVDTRLCSVTISSWFQNNISVLYVERAKHWFQLTHISYCLSLASDPAAIWGAGVESSKTIFRA